MESNQWPFVCEQNEAEEMKLNRRQHHRLAGLVGGHAGRFLIQRADRPDRIAGAVLAKARSRCILGGGPAGCQQLQAFARRTRPPPARVSPTA